MNTYKSLFIALLLPLLSTTQAYGSIEDCQKMLLNLSQDIETYRQRRDALNFVDFVVGKARVPLAERQYDFLREHPVFDLFVKRIDRGETQFESRGLSFVLSHVNDDRIRIDYKVAPGVKRGTTWPRNSGHLYFARKSLIDRIGEHADYKPPKASALNSLFSTDEGPVDLEPFWAAVAAIPELKSAYADFELNLWRNYFEAFLNELPLKHLPALLQKGLQQLDVSRLNGRSYWWNDSDYSFTYPAKAKLARGVFSFRFASEAQRVTWFVDVPNNEITIVGRVNWNEMGSGLPIRIRIKDGVATSEGFGGYYVASSFFYETLSMLQELNAEWWLR
jgi:hypothetical protein